MGKLELNKEKKRNALYSTAFELFTTQGITKTTISEIVEKAGVAKGTFYLYFKDKYDIRNKLVAHRAEELLHEAHQAMITAGITGFVPQIHFLVDFMLDHLQNNPAELTFIYKNLSWAIFKNLFEEMPSSEDYSFQKAYLDFLAQDSSVVYEEPELLLFTILELVNGTCYSCIVHRQPVRMEHFRPFLHRSIDGILDAFSVKGEKKDDH